MKGGIWFIIGCFVGSVVTQVWLDRHSSDGKPEEKKEEPKDANPETGKTEPQPESGDEKPSEEKKEGFREQTSIDGYEAPLAEERTAYEKIVHAEYDPADDESPTDEDSLDSLHEEVKNNPPREIGEKEYGNFGYQCDSLYYDKDFDVLMYDDEAEETIDDPQDVYRIVGDVLKYSPFKNDDSMTELYIRNYRLRTDYVVYKR